MQGLIREHIKKSKKVDCETQTDPPPVEASGQESSEPAYIEEAQNDSDPLKLEE